MAKYAMIVQSTPKPGREADYNEWYDTIHMPDILAIPGMLSCRRFKASPIAFGTPGQAYLTIYELETDDPATILAEMGQRGAEGKLRPSDSYEPDSPLWFYEQLEPTA